MKRVTTTSGLPAVKFLGILFDPELNFKLHIRSISTKISKALFILRRVKNLLSEKSLKTLYYSLVHCHLIYGIHIWSSVTSSNFKDLVIKQKQAIRTVTNSKYNLHTSPLLKKLEILPLESLITYFKIQFMSQYVQGFLPQAFNSVWMKREQGRAEEFTLNLRNSDDLYIPTALLAQTERHPLFLFPRLWSEFNNNDIKIIRNSKELNSAQKNTYLV